LQLQAFLYPTRLSCPIGRSFHPDRPKLLWVGDRTLDVEVACTDGEDVLVGNVGDTVGDDCIDYWEDDLVGIPISKALITSGVNALFEWMSKATAPLVTAVPVLIPLRDM
jgi:hypothetical protein